MGPRLRGSGEQRPARARGGVRGLAGRARAPRGARRLHRHTAPSVKASAAPAAFYTEVSIYTILNVFLGFISW